MPYKTGAWYRCNRCNTRRTLPRPAEEYIRPPKCRGCGSRLTYRDKHRERVELRRKPCCCDAFHYPHRPGSSVWCSEHPTGPTEADHIARWGAVTAPA